MVQNVGAYGAINKIGTTDNGRVIYQVIDGNGQIAGKMSIPQKDCDVFEKSYKDIIETAPKLQKFAEKHSTEESRKKLKKTSNWITGICAATGAGVAIFKTTNLKTWKQVLITTGGLIAGLAAGMGLSFSLTSPPGIMKFNKATQNISKLDIQPIQE